MPFEYYILIIPFCTIPVFLVSIDYLNKNAEIERKKHNVIDFDNFIRRQEEGDEIDSDIAELLDINKIAS